MSASLNIVLHEPEIPQNTGNIARSCVAMGARLHLIEPLGFELSDRYLKRAGMDYWQKLDYHVYSGIEEFFSRMEDDAEVFFVSTKAKNRHSDISYPDDCYFMFGRESRGLPEYLMDENPSRSLRIPMREGIRSLNLSSAAAVVAYEYMRQKNYPF